MKYLLSKTMFNVLMLFSLLATLLGSPVLVRPARADSTLIVTKSADTADGACNADCSLREAITTANALEGADNIIVPAGTYTLTRAGANENANSTGDLDITSDMTIQGNSSTDNRTVVIQAGTTEGSGIDRVFHVVSGAVTLTNLTIKNGRAPSGARGTECGPFGPCPSTSNGRVGQDGGGILNAANLSLFSVRVTNNWAGTGGRAGNLVCTLLGPVCKNEGGNGGRGGGVFSTGTLTVRNSIFDGNRAGNGGAAGTETCASSCNSYPGFGGDGGGVFNGGTPSATIGNSTFSGNSGDTGLGCPPFDSRCSASGGGIYNREGSTLNTGGNIFLSNNASFGGGLYNEGTLTITTSTFLQNSANKVGGGIYNHGAITIANSTFSKNVADGLGGDGLFTHDNNDPTTVINSTFNNSPIQVESGTLSLFNTILTRDDDAPSCESFGRLSGRNNLIKSTGSSICGLTNGTNGNIIGPDPNLGPLTGTPAFFTLESGSLAINTGNDAKCAAAPVNNGSQNGAVRPQGAHCDIGAFELDITPPAVSSIIFLGPDPVVVVPTLFSVDTFRVLFSEPVTNVDVADFRIVSTGTTSARVSNVTSNFENGAQIFVGVITNSGNGAIRLDVPASATITDLSGNALASLPFTTGDFYTVYPSVEAQFLSVGANDGFMHEAGENTGVGGGLNGIDTFFRVGDNAANEQLRAILHFDTSSLPDTAVIVSAVLELHPQGSAGIDPFTTHGPLQVDVASPFFGTAADLELVDFQAAPSFATAAIFNATPFGSVYRATFSEAGKTNINLAGTTQLRLSFLTDDNNNLSADFMIFSSGDADPSLAPHLIIRYYVP